jgi:hypothetical protein
MLMLMQMQCNYGAKHLRCYRRCRGNASTTRIRSRGEAGVVGALLFVAVLWGYGCAPVCCNAAGLRFCYGDGTGALCYAGMRWDEDGWMRSMGAESER